MTDYRRLTRPNAAFPDQEVTVGWYVPYGDRWVVMCMDCAIRVGTVDAEDTGGVARLTERHEGVLHL